MRRSLLRAAEIFGWMAAGFAAFLAFRVFFILLSVVNPAFCDISCELSKFAVPVAVACWIVGWVPLVIVGLVHYARRSLKLWWLPHASVMTVTFVAAMLYV